MRALLVLVLLAPQGRFAAAPEQKALKLGETEVHLALSGAGAPTLVHLHGDERTCMEAAASVLPGRSGRLVDLQAQGERRVHYTVAGRACSFDPNRAFTPKGLAKSVACEGKGRPPEAALEAARTFATAVLAELGSGPVLALHNNTEGALSIKSYLPGGNEAKAGAQVHVVPGEDEDDFFLVTAQPDYEALAAQGFNVVLQDNARAPDDGSLSVLFGQQSWRYVNIEAQHGHLARQQAMLRAALDLVAKVPH